MWVTNIDQRRKARDPKTSILRLLIKFTQSGLTESRKVEWDKWKHFNAVYPVSGPELEQLLVQGHTPIPLQWVDIDKNEHKRREGGPHVAPLFKSRLVSRGDLEETTGVRTDSPTCDIEGLNILLSWVSCERLTVKSGDITNAYIQGCPLEWLILMKQPPGGVPDVDISADCERSIVDDAHFYSAAMLEPTRRTLEVRSSARGKSEDKQSCVHKCNGVRV